MTMVRADKMAILIAPVLWPLSPLAETVTSDRASAACYRSLENLRVMAMIVAELEFCDVQRQVLFADVVERADNAALNQRPEAFNGLGMDGADNVLTSLVVNDGVRVVLAEPR